MRKILLLLAVLCGTAHAQRWSDDQRTLASMYAAAWAIDWGQTRRIAQEPQRWVERNPVLGTHPSVGRVNTYFCVAPLAGYLVLDRMGSENRTTVLKLLTMVEIATVAGNHSIGIRMSF